ncbi:MAG: ribosome maturation factor RimP [Desulfobacteraceae bacterium]|jgi:ribosome maturation factor RimP
MQGRKAIDEQQIVGAADNKMLAKVWHLAEPLCLAEAVELVHVEYLSEKGGRILRFFIDKPAGVTLDDCANISRQLGDILDVGLESQAPYRLEVSSPGTPRPLGKLDDFKVHKGGRIKIRTLRAINGQKNFSGVLEGVSGVTVHIKVDNQSVAIAFADIKKAYITNINGENACS